MDTRNIDARASEERSAEGASGDYRRPESRSSERPVSDRPSPERRQPETPEDVAVLYSWANLHGAKYRDFSASRREYRAQMRHRAAEKLKLDAEAKAQMESQRAIEALVAAEAAKAAATSVAEREAAAAAAELAAQHAQGAVEAAFEAKEAEQRAAVHQAMAHEAVVQADSAERANSREGLASSGLATSAEKDEMDRTSGVGGSLSDPYNEPSRGAVEHHMHKPAVHAPPPTYRSSRAAGTISPSPSEPQPPIVYYLGDESFLGGQPVHADPPGAEFNSVPTGAQVPAALNANDREDRMAEERAAEERAAEQRAALEVRIEQERRDARRHDEDRRAAAQRIADQRVLEERLAAQREAMAVEAERRAAEKEIAERNMREQEHREQKQRDIERRDQQEADRRVADQRTAAQRQSETERSLTESGDQRSNELYPRGSYPSTAEPIHPASRYDEAYRISGGFAGTYRSAGAAAPPPPGAFPASSYRGEQTQRSGGQERERGERPSDGRGKDAYRAAEAARPASKQAEFAVPAGRPAWLYESEVAVAQARLASATPPTPSVVAPSLGDTLQQSRERVASRWFALKGVFDGADQQPEAQPVRQKEARVPVLALFSLAGGVGKTSMVATLGRALASLGEKTLLTDTTSFGLLPYYFGARELKPGAMRTFSPPSGSTDAPVNMINLDVEQQPADNPAPGSGGPQDWLVEEITRNARGNNRVVVDLATASGALTRRILRMGPVVLVPVSPDLNSVISLSAAEQFFQNQADSERRAVKVYFVLNQFDASQPLHLDVREVLRQQLGERLLPFVIRRSPAVSEALAEGMTVMDYAPNSPVAEDYMNLATWVRTTSAPASLGFRGVRWSEQR